ncbi:hypothetical protein [Roseateles saccharophilus]|uniref:Uncharacterized protein n=1 Tax=Roseateles saccharophilus TaxID=304 RepID=A0A4R3UYJ0_ROSSA|nr:hypothetical protein [Roseateles saccharophilus]MDG0831919.1 hypothetical protein [Roseateles saccharophilus]TCU97416.1 hypothetical protein EV671_101191 [Roseateles saccharophilus]
MGYDRQYTREEIHQMLYLSERRLRPSSPAAKAHEGHAISRHTEQRDNPFDRRAIKQDSTFCGRKDLVLAVEEALHDVKGQQELATLNRLGVDSCAITVQLSAALGKITANVVQSPMAKIGKKQLPASGPQNYLQKVLVSSVFVLVDKLGSAESWAPLHIQTAYPKDLA